MVAYLTGAYIYSDLYINLHILEFSQFFFYTQVVFIVTFTVASDTKFYSENL